MNTINCFHIRFNYRIAVPRYLSFINCFTFPNHTRRRFSTWNIPRYIFCGNNDETFICLPRSLSDTVTDYLTESGFIVIEHDKRNSNENLELTFTGSLLNHQKAAVDALLTYDLGLLVAPTGTGKTVMAISMLAAQKCRTLILVHRSTLIPQWINALTRFVPELEKKQIGVLGGGRKKLKKLG